MAIPELRPKAHTTETRLLRIADVKRKVGLSQSLIYKKISDGEFPAPVPIGGRAVAWLEAELDDWIAQRVAEREQTALYQKRPNNKTQEH